MSCLKSICFGLLYPLDLIFLTKTNQQLRRSYFVGEAISSRAAAARHVPDLD
jgi:hypothetical protein